MNRRNILTLIAIALGVIAVPASHAVAQHTDIDGVKAASKAFYAALAVIDDGQAMDKVVAHLPYITFVGPRSKSIIVGWDAQKKYWTDANKGFSARAVSLSDQHIHVNGNLAWEMGRETGEVKLKNGSSRQADYIVTNVYEKIGGRWLMVSHHAQPKPR